MSLTADIADAIIAVDRALTRFEQANAIATNAQTYKRLKTTIENLQAVACGDGMHFDSLEDARRFRDVTDHKFMSLVFGTDEGCDFKYDGKYRCNALFAQHTERT